MMLQTDFIHFILAEFHLLHFKCFSFKTSKIIRTGCGTCAVIGRWNFKTRIDATLKTEVYGELGKQWKDAAPSRQKKSCFETLPEVLVSECFPFLTELPVLQAFLEFKYRIKV